MLFQLQLRINLKEQQDLQKELIIMENILWVLQFL